MNSESLSLENEIALIKSKLFNLTGKNDTENILDLSQISENSEPNAAISFLNSSLIEEKLANAWKNNKALANSQIEKFESELKQREDSIYQLRIKEESLVKELENYQEKVKLYEDDLDYCVEQNNAATLEIQELKEMLLEKDSIIRQFEEEKAKPYLNTMGKMNYKFYSELELHVNYI